MPIPVQPDQWKPMADPMLLSQSTQVTTPTLPDMDKSSSRAGPDSKKPDWPHPASHTTRTSATKTAHRPDTVLESLISETHHAAARTAIVTSWTNALATPEISINAPTIRTLIPEDPAIMVTMRRWIETTTLDVEALHSTEEFFATLKAARKSFDLFLAEASQIGFVRAGILHRSLLSGTWKLTANRALETLNAQKSETTENLPEIYSDNAIALRALMARVIAGETPCLNADASARLPDLPNQRRSARRYLLENCLIKTERHTFTAFARDVSEGGLGLNRVPQIPKGTLVTVRLPTGRTFKGNVQWYKNASAGIKFVTPLPPNDPLLTS